MESSPPDPGLLASLGPVDLTALAILVVFFVLGLFRGFVWQVSRILTLVLAYVVAGTYGEWVAARIDGWFPADTDEQLPLYIAYFCVFLVVLVVIGVLAHFIDKLVQDVGLTFYNRLGGGLLGIVTGGAAVLALLATMLMFFAPDSGVVEAAQRSRSMELGRRTLDALGGIVPEPVQELFAPEPEVEAEGRRELEELIHEGVIRGEQPGASGG